jgi:hypothetical protein
MTRLDLPSGPWHHRPDGSGDVAESVDIEHEGCDRQLTLTWRHVDEEIEQEPEQGPTRRRPFETSYAPLTLRHVELDEHLWQPIDLPTHVFEHVMSFLPPADIALSQRVAQPYQNQIRQWEVLVDVMKGGRLGFAHQRLDALPKHEACCSDPVFADDWRVHVLTSLQNILIRWFTAQGRADHRAARAADAVMQAADAERQAADAELQAAFSAFAPLSPPQRIERIRAAENTLYGHALR